MTKKPQRVLMSVAPFKNILKNLVMRPKVSGCQTFLTKWLYYIKVGRPEALITMAAWFLLC